jgi:hypothetical protein
VLAMRHLLALCTAPALLDMVLFSSAKTSAKSDSAAVPTLVALQAAVLLVFVAMLLPHPPLGAPPPSHRRRVRE